MLDNLFKSPSHFSLHIEQKVRDTGEPYLTTILEFCAEHMIEYEDITKLISQPLKEKIYEEAKKEFRMPSSTTAELEFDE